MEAVSNHLKINVYDTYIMISVIMINTINEHGDVPGVKASWGEKTEGSFLVGGWAHHTLPSLSGFVGLRDSVYDPKRRIACF